MLTSFQQKLCVPSLTSIVEPKIRLCVGGKFGSGKIATPYLVTASHGLIRGAMMVHDDYSLGMMVSDDIR